MEHIDTKPTKRMNTKEMELKLESLLKDCVMFFDSKDFGFKHDETDVFEKCLRLCKLSRMISIKHSLGYKGIYVITLLKKRKILEYELMLVDQRDRLRYKVGELLEKIQDLEDKVKELEDTGELLEEKLEQAYERNQDFEEEHTRLKKKIKSL